MQKKVKSMEDVVVDEMYRRVLVVDDDSENLHVLERILTAKNYQLALFTRGDQALKAARRFSPDAVLLDIKMPGMDGFEICRRLKEYPELNPVPVLFLSGMSSGEDVAAGFEAGAVDFVTKPIREQELLARLNTQIRLYKVHDQLSKQHAQLCELEVYRDTLVHMLVHDMRSPLQAMMGHLQLVERGAEKVLDDGSRDSLSRSIAATRLLSRLVSEIIDVNRLENQKMTLHCDDVEVRTLLSRVVSIEESHLADRTIKLTVSATCPSIHADPLLLERVLLNLIDNALKHSPPASDVFVRAEQHPAGVCITIEDQGEGIAEGMRDKVFEKFVTDAKQAGQRSRSSGLGLAFCKLAVEAQGGTIGFSNIPNSGCAFWIILPSRPPV